MASRGSVADQTIALYWRGMSYAGNTGSAAESGGRRRTQRCTRRSPPSNHAASNMTVSDDMPFDGGTFEVGHDRLSTRLANHRWIWSCSTA